MGKKTVDIDTYAVANRLHKIDEREALKRICNTNISNVISTIARYIQSEVAAALEIIP